MALEKPKCKKQEKLPKDNSRSTKEIPRNPNRKPTNISMERSIAHMRAEHREVIRRAMQ